MIRQNFYSNKNNQHLNETVIKKQLRNITVKANVQQFIVAVFSKTYNTGFDEIITIYTGKNGSPLEIEDEVNLTLLINTSK